MVDISAQQPLVFDYAYAEDVRAALWSISERFLEQSVGSLVSCPSFRGVYGSVFESNMARADADRELLAIEFAYASGLVLKIIESAEREDQRRRLAREFIERHDDWYDKIRDWFSAGEEPPNLVPFDEPVFGQPAPVVSARVDPLEKAGAYTDVSSADPQELRDAGVALEEFADTVGDLIVKASSLLEDFSSKCRWGQFDAHGVMVAGKDWVDLTRNDVQWLDTVASAFEAAGGVGGICYVSDSAIRAVLESKGLFEYRAGLTIKPACVLGIEPTNGYAGDPVHVVTGNFIEPETDVRFTGLASCFALERVYNSAASFSGVFGCGWHSTLDQFLRVEDQTITLVRFDGREFEFDRAEPYPIRAVLSDVWIDVAHAPSFLPDADGEVFVVRDNRGGCKYFDQSGRWLGDQSAPDRVILAVREGDRIVALQASNGQVLHVEYARGMVCAVRSDSGRIAYEYDDARLTVVSKPGGQRRYHWNSDSLIEQIVNEAGVRELVNTYDDHGRVVKQTTAHDREIHFSYLPGGVTVVGNSDGQASTTWVSDQYGRLKHLVDAQGERQTMMYDKYGHLIQVTGRDGAETICLFDERGRCVQARFSHDGQISHSWDELDRIVEISRSDGACLRFTYETDSRQPSMISDACGAVTYLEWSGSLLLKVTNPVGITLEFAYDSRGDLIRVKTADGAVTRCERDRVGRITEVVMPDGGVHRFTYDADGHVVEHVDPVGGVQSYVWEGNELCSYTAPDGGLWQIVYGEHGCPVARIDPLGRKTTLDYDVYGNISRMILPDGDQWNFANDTLSRLTEITSPSGATWSIGYSREGLPARFTDPLGGIIKQKTTPRGMDVCDGRRISKLEFDEFGRAKSIFGQAGDARLISYDLQGNPIEVVHSDGSITLLRRDLAGRIVEQVDRDGNKLVLGYDRVGYLSHVTTSSGAMVDYAYDKCGRITEIACNDGEVESYTYDLAGRVVERLSNVSGYERYAYDACGRVIRVESSFEGVRRYSYDAAGQLISVCNGVGGTVSFTYDGQGRIASCVNPAGQESRWEYNELDLPTCMTTPAGTYRNKYDANGRLIEQTTPDGRVTSYDYDAYGQKTRVLVDGVVASERAINGRRVTISDYLADSEVCQELVFDDAGQLSEVITNGTSVRYGYSSGLCTTVTDNAGATTTYSYDEFGRLSQMSHPFYGVTEYSYDQWGNITRIVTPDSCQEWTYRNGQVVHYMVSRGGQISETFIDRDKRGLICRIIEDGRQTLYTYDCVGQLASVTSAGVETRWEYNPLGAVAAHITGNTRRDFNYDDTGRLASISVDGNQIAQFSYDAGGRRVREQYPDKVVKYSWNKRNLLSRIEHVEANQVSSFDIRYDCHGLPIKINNHGITWDLASIPPRPLTCGEMPIDTTVSSWRMVRPVESANPWQAVQNGIVNAAGHVTVAGLEILGERIYDSDTFAFISPDRIAQPMDRPWAWNPYAYAANNPLLFSDPYGTEQITDEDIRALGRSGWDRIKDAGKNLWSKDGLIGGLMIAGGAALCFVPALGQFLGPAVIGAGIDTLYTKATTGEVNYASIFTSSTIGLGLPVAGKVISLVGKKILAYMPGFTSAVARASSQVTSLAQSGVSKIANSGIGQHLTTMASPAWKKISGLGAVLDSPKVPQIIRDGMTNWTWKDTATDMLTDYTANMTADMSVGGKSFAEAFADNTNVAALKDYAVKSSFGSLAERPGASYRSAHYGSNDAELKAFSGMINSTRESITHGFDAAEDWTENTISRIFGDRGAGLYEQVEDAFENVRDAVKK